MEVKQMAQSLKSVGVITLFVEDQQRSKEFYERVFEVTAVNEDEGSVIFKFDNLFLRLLTRVTAETELLGQVAVADSDSGPSFQLAIFVEDADALCADLAERGVPIVYGPVDRPWGVRHAAFRDPDGHLWVFSADIPEN
jgi:catechol 2,3-dioxygenase-like lactoylglutathione lyase family enzyme